MIDERQNYTSVEARLARLSRSLRRVAREELAALQPRMMLLRLTDSLLPAYVGGRLRGRLMRLAGFRIGQNTTIVGMPHIYGVGDLRGRLSIGDCVMLNINCHFDLSDTITIMAHASLGHEVMLLTASHHIAGPDRRAGALFTGPIAIGRGAWIGARSLILPGVSIGAGSIVAAGAVVTKEVPPGSMVAGIPARIVRQLEP